MKDTRWTKERRKKLNSTDNCHRRPVASDSRRKKRRRGLESVIHYSVVTHKTNGNCHIECSATLGYWVVWYEAPARAARPITSLVRHCGITGFIVCTFPCTYKLLENRIPVLCHCIFMNDILDTFGSWSNWWDVHALTSLVSHSYSHTRALYRWISGITI